MQSSLNRCRSNVEGGRDTEWPDVEQLLLAYGDVCAGIDATNVALLVRLNAVEDALKDAVADARAMMEDRSVALARVKVLEEALCACVWALGCEEAGWLEDGVRDPEDWPIAKWSGYEALKQGRAALLATEDPIGRG